MLQCAKMYFSGDPHTYGVKLVAFAPKLALSITLLWGKFPPSYEVHNEVVTQNLEAQILHFFEMVK